jgi:nucleoside-diphosphate-sugar epimerase
MRVLLAGGTGVLGRSAATALTADGHTVTSLGRGEDNDVRADLLDRDALLRALDGGEFDVVVHAATALRGKAMAYHRDLAATNALRSTGTVHLLDAAREVGARRFVAESMMFGYGFGDHGGALLSEDSTPFGPRGAKAPLERHLGAIRAIEESTLNAEGIEGVALRFGMFYGAGVTDVEFVPRLRRRVLPVVRGRRDLLLSWVSADDAGRAVAAAVRTGATGATGATGRSYNIADDTPVSFADHMRAVADAFGAPRPSSVPLGVLRATPMAYALMSTDLRLDNTKAGTDLNWRPQHTDSTKAVRDLAAQSQDT